MKDFGSGLYVVGYYIQVMERTFTDKTSGEVKTKYYLVLGLGGKTGVVNVGISADEYARLVTAALPVGALVSGPVEVFGYQNKAYLRLTGPIESSSSQIRVEGVA